MVGAGVKRVVSKGSSAEGTARGVGVAGEGKVGAGRHQRQGGSGNGVRGGVR